MVGSPDVWEDEPVGQFLVEPGEVGEEQVFGLTRVRYRGLVRMPTGSLPPRHWRTFSWSGSAFREGSARSAGKSGGIRHENRRKFHPGDAIRVIPPIPRRRFPQKPARCAEVPQESGPSAEASAWEGSRDSPLSEVQVSTTASRVNKRMQRARKPGTGHSRRLQASLQRPESRLKTPG